MLPAPAGVSAQSLGEVARQYRKEQEARIKKGEVPVKVFTNDDIARMFPPAMSDSSAQRAVNSAGPAAPMPGQAAPPASPKAAGGEAPAGSAAPQPPKTEDSKKSKEYWQARFKAASAALSQARAEQTLVEDELRLLQIQQARELDPGRSRKLNARIDRALIELEAKRAATEKAQAALDKTVEEFKKSGAPQDWLPSAKESH